MGRNRPKSGAGAVAENRNSLQFARAVPRGWNANNDGTISTTFNGDGGEIIFNIAWNGGDSYTIRASDSNKTFFSVDTEIKKQNHPSWKDVVKKTQEVQSLIDRIINDDRVSVFSREGNVTEISRRIVITNEDDEEEQVQYAIRFSKKPDSGAGVRRWQIGQLQDLPYATRQSLEVESTGGANSLEDIISGLKQFVNNAYIR
jgi:hypothetical protein